MQIVIDISKDDLDAIKYLKAKGWASRHELLILNGTPLDEVLEKIRAEIEQMDFDFGDFYDHTDTIIEMVLEIIDKYRGDIK